MLDFGSAKTKLEIDRKNYSIYSIPFLKEMGYNVDSIPISLKILIENLLRRYDGKSVTQENIEALIFRRSAEIPFYPGRVILQDYTGIPVLLDLIAMRTAMQKMNGDPSRINPTIPIDLVVDHSVQIDRFGTSYAISENRKLEYERNSERYSVLKWATNAFKNFRVVPPGNGIIHQVNIEYLATVVSENNGVLYPDTLIGTDSHTTMINGLGVLGWGVGGLEAESVVVGEPTYILIPEVVGVKITGRLNAGVTATDTVLTVTELLRKKKVVGKFIEFYGPGLKNLTLQDRATIANMAPEYGATMGFFPVDEITLKYLEETGRDKNLLKIIESYLKHQGLFYQESLTIEYNDTVELDLSQIEPSIAGPSNPDERIALKNVQESLGKILLKHKITDDTSNSMHSNYSELGVAQFNPSTNPNKQKITIRSEDVELGDFSVVIAAITSCTNTSNPSVLIGAGLLAKNAVERGLKVRPHVKTSLAPGSTVVTEYLNKAGLLPYLEALGFHVVGYGCTTCIGNSGPLIKEVEKAVKEKDYYVAAVLSGNRNFEGRINPYVKGAFLASPMLVVAFALAGRMDIDLTKDPIGTDPNGVAVYLSDLWPSETEIKKIIEETIDPELYTEKYSKIFEGDELWNNLFVPSGELYTFDPKSTYIKEPPWFDGFSLEPEKVRDIKNSRIIAIFGDNITTDHISPAGVIAPDLSKYQNLDLTDQNKTKDLVPAAVYLLREGVTPEDFNTYGSRRGNHEVMVRGGFANIKIKNKMDDRVGGFTKLYPSAETFSIYDTAMKYKAQDTPLVLFAGKRYGAGSSRDWAAKATALLGIKAVIAESFERIHRSNLIDMGILPIQIDSPMTDLKGDEIVDISGLEENLSIKKEVDIRVRSDRESKIVKGVVRLDTDAEVDYFKNAGILNYTLRKILSSKNLSLNKKNKSTY